MEAQSVAQILTLPQRQDNVPRIVKKVEWFDDRFYKVLLPPAFSVVDFFPSSTTILGIIDKPWLRTWYGNLGTERAQYQSKQAMARGSRIHELVHLSLQFDQFGQGPTTPVGEMAQEEWIQVLRFTEFYQSLKPIVYGSEMEVASYAHRFAGTLDLLIWVEDGDYDLGYAKPIHLNRGLYVVDLKTGQEDIVYRYQAASYAVAVQHMELGSPVGTIILYTKAGTKKGWKCDVRNREQLIEDFKCFQAAQHLYLSKGEDRPKVFEMPDSVQLTRYESPDANVQGVILTYNQIEMVPKQVANPITGATYQAPPATPATKTKTRKPRALKPKPKTNKRSK